MKIEPQPGEITGLLRAWSAGDRSVEQRLFELVLPDLHRIAGAMMRRERPDHSLQPTALLNEAYVKLVGVRERDWQDRRHFYALAARAMRRLLIDHARQRPRGERIAEGLEELLRGRESQLETAVSIDHLLDQMAVEHQDWCTIIELKFYWGFTDEEAAEALDVRVRSLQRKFADARRWIYEKLEPR